MAPNAFIGKMTAPTDEELSNALAAARPTWDQFLAELNRDLGVTVHEWKCYSPKAGWSMRAKRKERTIVWLGPREGCFVAVFILGEKAMNAARACKLPQRITRVIETAPKYAEGTGVRITVKTPNDIATLKMLATIKIAN
jgi:hypothetical protein